MRTMRSGMRLGYRSALARDSVLRICIIALLTGVSGAALQAQSLIDPGFESYDVFPGGYVRLPAGSWTFTNDAGVVEPVSPNSSTGALHTWSATRAAYEGQQYVSTYANIDTVRQSVIFPAAGTYRLSVAAFSPDGMLTIPGVFTNQPLADGHFRFWFGAGETGADLTVPAGADWGVYTTDVTVAAPGTYSVGVSNTVVAKYFVNYDAFQVTAIPEPATFVLLSGSLFLALCRRR